MNVIFSSSDLVKALPDNYFSAMDDKVNLYKSKGIDVINLAAGNPDQPTPAHIISTLKEAVDQPINQGYPPFHGKKARWRLSPRSINGSIRWSWIQTGRLPYSTAQP